MNHINRFKTVLMCTLAIVTSITLASCEKHHNILLTMPKQKISELLYKASLYAERKLNTGDLVYPGDTYMDCVNGNDFNPRECPYFYKAMVEYAHKQSEFRSLTVADLTDDSAIYRITKTFNRIVYSHPRDK